MLLLSERRSRASTWRVTVAGASCDMGRLSEYGSRHGVATSEGRSGTSPRRLEAGVGRPHIDLDGSPRPEGVEKHRHDEPVGGMLTRLLADRQLSPYADSGDTRASTPRPRTTAQPAPRRGQRLVRG